MFFRYFSLLCFLLSLIACNNNQSQQNQNSKHQQYLYIGHSYDWKAKDGNRIDPRISSLNLRQYDQLWLGGDLCTRTSQKQSTLTYLDEVLQISSPTTLWALGNHDLTSGNPAYISPATKRPFFYSQSANGITHLVLNTNLGHSQLAKTDSSSLCKSLNDQFELIKNVTDTIESSAYLILLHHHGLITDSLANGRKEVLDKWHFLMPHQAFRCSPEETFEEAIYPLLTKVQQKGVQVILVGGDIGQRAKKFEFQTKEGIWFLGSGINNSMDKTHRPKYVTNVNPDSLLVFDYDLSNRKLKWDFFEL